jgi:hypothetical protein
MHPLLPYDMAPHGYIALCGGSMMHHAHTTAHMYHASSMACMYHASATHIHVTYC